MLIKRTAVELFNRYPNEIRNDFDSNKKVASDNADIPSKKLRNAIAGYLARLKKQKDIKDKK